MGEEEEFAVIIENGSKKMKAGFSGDDRPRAVFPSVVGVPRAIAGACPAKDMSVGDEAVAQRSTHTKHMPIHDGFVTQWDKMEGLWHHIFHDKLRVSPEEHRVLLTEPPLNPKVNREKMARMMFETFSVPAMYVSISQVLSMYASGKTTGVVVDCGSTSYRTVPVWEGYALPHAIRRVDVGGHDLSSYMQTLLHAAGYSFTAGYHDYNTVIDIKEKVSYVALHLDTEMKKLAETPATGAKAYALPDGRTIKVGTPRFRCPEALFDPNLMGKDTDTGVHQTTFDTITACDESIRKALCGHIVLAGGSSMFPGFQQRLAKEITALAPPTMKVNVVADPQRWLSAWLGGAILAELGSFESMWITREEYADNGPAVVHRKCF